MQNNESTGVTAASIERDGSTLTLKAGGCTAAVFVGQPRYPYTRRPFFEYSAESALWSRYGVRKVNGEYAVNFAAGMGVAYADALRIVNEVLSSLGWPEVAAKEQPASSPQLTTIVAYILPEDAKCAPLIFRALHAPATDPIAAIKAAAQEFVGTPDGQEYLRTNVGADCFNWGDAVIAIPAETLARHGVQSLVVENVGPCALAVDHDESITG